MTIWQMSLWASVVILATVVIRSLALHKIPKKTFLVLWGLALIRLLVPFQFNITLPVHVTDIPVVSQLQEISQLNPVDITATQNAPAMAVTADVFSIPLPVLLWLAVAICMSLYFITSHMRYRKAYKLAIPTDDENINKWLKANTLKWRTVKVKISADISAPLTYGLFHPVILIPKATDLGNQDQLQYILTHEVTHIRRFDTLWKWLMMIAVCIHWFNPLVWVMYVLANRDLEITCDEKVVRTFGENNKSSYALTLIELAAEQAKIMPLGSAFSKNSIEERTLSIMNTKKITTLGVIIAVVAVITIAAVTALAANDGTANGKSDDVMPQDISTTWAQYDSDGNLIVYHTVDENGNDVYLDYEPELPEGDIKVKDEDAVSFFSQDIDCINGVSGEHRRTNGEMAVYMNDGGTWSLKSGQIVEITFNTKAIEGSNLGSAIWFGYLKDGEYIRYGYDPNLNDYQSFRLLDGDDTTISFCTPEDGEYSFFMVNMSPGTIYVNSCTISA